MTKNLTQNQAQPATTQRFLAVYKTTPPYTVGKIHIHNPEKPDNPFLIDMERNPAYGYQPMVPVADRPKLLDVLKAHGVPHTVLHGSGTSIEIGYLKRLEVIAKELGMDVTFERVTLRLETPTREGASAHIARRRVLETFLQTEGVEYTVECFTVHSSNVCQSMVPVEAPAEPAAITTGE